MGGADTHIRSLEIARDCAALGARQRTIAWITGLNPNFILRIVFHEHPAPIGRPPYAEDFFFQCTLRVQTELSFFAIKYSFLTQAGFGAAESLIAAYRHYLLVCTAPSFCFDEAFHLASNLDGIWSASAATLELGVCRRCGCTHVMSLGSLPPSTCPFCRRTYDDDVPDADSHFGRAERVDGAGESGLVALGDRLPQHIHALRFRRCLEDLGAHLRVVSALMSSLPTPYIFPVPTPPKTLFSGHRRLPLHRWGEIVKTPLRAQYALIAITYRRVVGAGFCPPDALVGAYRHVRSLTPGGPLLFDRCFEVVALLDALWGAAEPQLDLVPCGKCGAQHLVSRIDRRPAHCPFCLLLRFPNLYFRADSTDPPATSAST